jgi:superfamily II DNA or RNA helicase
MYDSNEKAKIKGVRKNVMDAWNDSISNPINNATLEGIISEQNALLKPKESILKNEYKHKLTTQYIGEDSKAMKLICDVVRGNKFTSLSAGMGMGKTTMLLQLQKMLNKQIIISVPTVAIAQQQYNATILDSNVDAALVIGGVFGDKINEDADIIYVTNASIGKLQKIEDKVLIVDEAHLTSDR